MEKTVLVTGACINTGVAIVNKFLKEGWKVVFTGRDPEKVERARKNYLSRFPNASVLGYVIDALKDGKVDEESVDEMFKYFDNSGIKINCLVLNAAHQGLNMRIFESPLSDFMKVINVNMTWDYCLIEYSAKRMRDYGGGSIIFVNSNTAYRAIPDRIAYSASKSGQLGMMRALALDLGKYNIRVNAVLPGMIRTDRWVENPEFYKNVPSIYTPLKDVAYGEDIADGVYYFAEFSRNTTGAELTIDGGNTIQLYPIIPKE